jgi:SAM-dependent methyltransferase
MMYPVNRPVALQEEIEFWRDWFLTSGSKWPQDYHDRFNPEQPIRDHVATYVDRLKAERIQILDVGSGPLTKIGMKHPSKQLEITATDLLAREYDLLIAELGIERLVPTIYADAERLVDQFGGDSFDIVHGENCVDHMVDPLRAIDQMLAVCKPHGFVVLYHAENEGQRHQYHQLHQWDFTCKDGSFVISYRREQEINVTKRLAAYAEVECVRNGDEILTGIHKLA